MKTKMSIVFFIIFGGALSAFCQKEVIVLTKTVGTIPKTTVKVAPSDEDTSKLKMPNRLKFKFFNYYYTSLAPVEEAFRRYKAGQLSYEMFLAKVKMIDRYAKVDTAELTANIKKYRSSKIHMISGIDLMDNKLVLIDANQDGVISDNEIFSFSPGQVAGFANNPHTSEGITNILLTQTADDGTQRSANIKIFPVAITTRNTNLFNKSETDFSLLRNEYWQGSTTIKDQQFIFYMQSKSFYNELGVMQFRIKCNDKLDGYFTERGDNWHNDTLSFTIDSLAKMDDNHSKLYITYQSPPRRENDTTFTMSIQNVSNNNFETLSPFLHHNKYILLDYWGTWCVPCIEKIPTISKIQKQFSNKVDVISIAYDVDIKTVKNFEASHDINWHSYFIDRSVQINLTKPLKIYRYPTFRLYNEDGKMIFSGEIDADKDLATIVQLLSK